MPDWMFWPMAVVVLGAVAWAGVIAHQDRWWRGEAWLVVWYACASVVAAGLVALRMVS